MTEVTTTTKNPFSGVGYSNSAIGRMSRIADYIKAPEVFGTIQKVMPEGSERFVASVLNEIRKSTSDDKKDLTVCEPQSIVNAIIDAATMRLALDGRQHAHLIKRGKSVNLQIGFRGYLARLNEKLSGFAPTVAIVYKGDEFKSGRKGSLSWFEHIDADPFKQGGRPDSDIIGAYAYLEWVGPDGQRVSVLETMDRKTIDAIKAKAQQDFIWKEWYGEKAKVAVIRRACKMHFASVTHDLDEKDNENFDFRPQTTSEHTEGLSSRIGQGLEAVEVESRETEVVSDVPDIITVTQDIDDLTPFDHQ